MFGRFKGRTQQNGGDGQPASGLDDVSDSSVFRSGSQGFDEVVGVRKTGFDEVRVDRSRHKKVAGITRPVATEVMTLSSSCENR